MSEQNMPMIPVSDDLLEQGESTALSASVSEGRLEPQLAAYIETLVTRRVQGEQDKRFARLEKQYHALLERVAGPTMAAEVSDPLPAVALEDVVDANAAMAQTAPLQRLPAEEVLESDAPAEADPTMTALLTVLTQLSAQMGTLPAVAPSALSVPSASTIIQPTGGLPRPDLATEYARRRTDLRPGDVHGLMALKREFRAKGMEIF